MKRRWVAAILALAMSFPVAAAEKQSEQSLGSQQQTYTPSLAVVTTVTYQWQDLRAGGTFVDVSGATGPTYTVQDSDIGSLIRVVVTATDTDGTAISTISNIDAPNLATQNGSELDVNLPNGGQNYTIKSDASGGISVYARGFVQPFTGIASVVVTGGHGSDTINSYAGGVAVTITGGSGGDLFAFDATALDDAQTSPPVHQELTDYNANEGDSVDVSPLVSVPYAGGSGSPPDALVRVIADSVGDFANLQVNLAGAGSNWITIARLDGLNIGDNINVILDQSSPAVSIGVLPTLGTLNGTELDLRIPNGDRTYTIGNEGAGVVVAAFGQSQHFDGVHSIVVTGSNGVDTVTLAQGLTIPATVKMPPSSTGTGIFTAALGDTFTGGNGADKFIFNQAALDGVPALRLEQITNYGHGQGDQIDLSALLSNAYNNGNGFPVSRLVRSVEDLSGTFAKVQINPTGVHDKTAWKTIATLGGLHDRDLINVVLDPSQPAGVDISVIPQPTISINTVAGDDRINALEATAGLAISGKTHAVEDGQIVTVTVVDSNNTTVETLTTPVANDTWAANLTTAQANMLVGDPYTIKADVSDVEEIDAPEASHDINPFTPTLYFTSQNFYLGVLLSNDWTSTVLVQPPGLPAFIASTNWSGPAGGGGGAIPTPDDYVELTPTTTDTVFIGASTYQNTNIPLEVKGLLVPDGITLTENAGPLTVDSLLLNSGSINVNASALVVSGELATKGLITVNNGALAARGTLVLDWTGSVKLGGGRITGSDPNAVATLENFVAIGGAGTIGSDGGAPLVLHNHGIIAGAGSGQLLTIATPFADATSAATNDGILEAVDQGGLLIRQTTLIQPNGVIEAIGAGANVLVASSTIEGGILATFGVLPGSDHGTIRSIDANATLDGLSAGAVTIAPGANLLVTDHDTGNEQWNLKGVIHNFGTFLVQPDQYFAHVNAITIDAAGVTLDSGGMIALNQLNGSALLQGATLYNVDNKIGGFGTITATVVNEKNGYIETIPDYQGTLTYSAAQFTNGGTVWTYGGSNIKFVGTTIYGNYQGAIGELVADKANIDLFTTTLEGGTLESANGHAISVDDAAVTFDSTTPAGEVTVAPDATVLVTDVNTGNETLTLKGLIHNFGTVLVQPTQYFAHTNAITVDAVTGVTLDSGGMIALNAVNGSAVLQGGVLENVDNTIGGFGAISATIVNEAAGRIQTRQVTPGILSITAGQLTNYGLIWTQGASAVELHGTTVIQGKQQNPLGHINATNANIDLFGATIEGGTLTTFGNNTISVDDSGVIFDSTTDAGSVTLASGSTVLVTDHHSTNENLVLKGLIHNFGTFLVQPDQYFAHTNAITIDAASVTLDSGGTIALNAVNGSAVLQGGQLTNVDNLIHGTGLIGNGLTLINQAAGVVDADSTGQLTINTDTNVVTNRGLIESTSAAGLLITNSTIDNKGALIKADGATANLYLQSSTIKGGTITETNGGAIRAIDSAVILDGSSSAGAITVSTGTTLTVTDHNSTNEQWILKGTIHNFGTFLVQPDQYFAHVNAVTIDAGGVTLELGRNGYAQLREWQRRAAGRTADERRQSHPWDGTDRQRSHLDQSGCRRGRCRFYRSADHQYRHQCRHQSRPGRINQCGRPADHQLDDRQ